MIGQNQKSLPVQLVQPMCFVGKNPQPVHQADKCAKGLANDPTGRDRQALAIPDEPGQGRKNDDPQHQATQPEACVTQRRGKEAPSVVQTLTPRVKGITESGRLRRTFGLYSVTAPARQAIRSWWRWRQLQF